MSTRPLVSLVASRRYEDAGRVFGTALLHIGRISGMRSYQHEQVNKRIDQMLGLLAICVTFQPQYVDEAASGLLKDKFGEKLARMKVGDDTAFSELFTYACPKFVTPSPPNYDVIKDYNMDALKLQLSLFMAEVRTASPLHQSSCFPLHFLLLGWFCYVPSS